MKVGGCAGMLALSAPVAQMDRVLASEAKGRAFESRRARHFSMPSKPALLWSTVTPVLSLTRSVDESFNLLPPRRLVPEHNKRLRQSTTS